MNTGGASSTILNQGKIYADAAGGTILIGSTGTFNNQGLMQANSGTLHLDAFQAGGTFNLSGTGILSNNWSGGLDVSGDFLGSGTGTAGSDPRGNATFDGSGSAGGPQLLEVMSSDLGNTAAGFSHNFVYGKLTQATGFLRLVDQADNAPGTGPEALYVDSLIVSTFDTLDLNGLHVYVRRTDQRNRNQWNHQPASRRRPAGLELPLARRHQPRGQCRYLDLLRPRG